MRIVCWQTILMKYHTLLFRKLGKMSQNLSSAAVVIGALRVKMTLTEPLNNNDQSHWPKDFYHYHYHGLIRL